MLLVSGPGVPWGVGAVPWGPGAKPGDRGGIRALVDGGGLRARPRRAARGWGYQRLSALGTIVVIDAAPPPPARMAPLGTASTLAFEMSDGAQRLVVNCGGPGPVPSDLPPELVVALRTTAAFSTLSLNDCNSTAILDDGMLGKGVGDVVIDRAEDNDSSRLDASHDGYVRGFGLLHERSMILGNDGKEVRGQDKLTPKGRKKIKADIPYAIRFHLAPGVEATRTADGMGAILRAPGAPPWNFRCRGAMLAIEESINIDHLGAAIDTQQLVVVGEISSLGGTVAWQIRRSS
ncbi:MAG: heparinase II/III family protein [Sphingomonas bacterium]|nr:heparinase II/III family protein [Sphingomonas bacterium]